MKLHSSYSSFTVPGYKLFTLTAEDDDLPDGEKLQFSVKGDKANDLLRIVQTGNKSADVLLKSELDREASSSYI